jgi:23S rRNA (uracil1939-C5)-methyltransferase
MAERLTVVLEKPVAGGHMLTRVDGRVVLVRGGIPGETVRIEMERTGKGVAFARVVEVEHASPDRVLPEGDPQCGGLVLAHIAYPRQLQVKQAIVEDALGRIGRLRDVPPITTIASPTRDWRLRARLHVAGRRVGFFREGTHALCDAGPTGQLMPGLLSLAQAVVDGLADRVITSVDAVLVTSTLDGEQHAVHLELARPLPRHGDVWTAGDAPSDLGGRCTGVSAGLAASRHPVVVAGHPWVRESWRALGLDGAEGGLMRHAAAFFQGNRALLPTMVREIADATPADVPVVDLYAGVGLFGLAAAVRGASSVTCVEGDPISAEDLVANAAPLGSGVRAIRGDVESFVRREERLLESACVIVDPPRTGLSPVVSAALAASQPSRVLYVSCDPATLARDLRVLTESDLRLERIAVLDMFPQTAHIETLVTLTRAQ